VFRACQIPLKSGLPSAVRGAVYFGAAAGAAAAGGFCAHAGDGTIACMIAATIAVTAMYSSQARIQISVRIEHQLVMVSASQILLS
jgi:hypothetical protein